MTEFVPFGRNFHGNLIEVADVVDLLGDLKAALTKQSLNWSDVSLLIVCNSKNLRGNDQHESDAAVPFGISQFCADEGWYPSLVGSSVHSAFYAHGEDLQANIDNGLLFVAVISRVLDRIPVGIDVTNDGGERSSAGALALKKATARYADRMVAELGVAVPPHTIPQTSMGIVFTSGSGHMESVADVDFRDCYAVGVELLHEANRSNQNTKLFGGCSTNKSEKHFQCLYYSQEVANKVQYLSTRRHAAVVALIPHAVPQAHLAHPYLPSVDVAPLDIEFDHRAMYKNRCFSVKKINDRPVTEFLTQYWPGAEKYLDDWIAGNVPIPARPEAHGVTIASSGSVDDATIWPNVAVWLERDSESSEVLLRLVRAVPSGANHYLMEMLPDPVTALRTNAENLLENLRFAPDSSVIAFLCESRKMLLEHKGSNAEAETLIHGAPSARAVIGVYLNGEYSTGFPSSIGYHNYSQIAAFVPASDLDTLPNNVYQAISSRGTQLFLCHSSEDKALAKNFIRLVSKDVPGSREWIDEEQITIGDKLRTVIAGAIAHPKGYVIPILTSRSVNSEWVRIELKKALKHERTTGEVVVLPVMFDPDGSVQRSLVASLGKQVAAELISRLHLVVRSQEDAEMNLKARQLGSAIRKRNAQRAQRDAAAPKPRVWNVAPDADEND